MNLFEASANGLSTPGVNPGRGYVAGASAPGPPTVAIYDDNELARAGMAALLNGSAVDVLADARSDPERILGGPLGEAPDVALVAIGGQGVEVAHRLGRERRSPVLLMLEEPPDGDLLLKVAAIGATGAVCRECPPERLLRGIRAVASGAAFFECAHRASSDPSPPPPSLLSERERHVALELARGAQSEEIAEALCISPHTARTHIRNIKRKLGARTLAQAVALAITMRLVTPPPA